MQKPIKTQEKGDKNEASKQSDSVGVYQCVQLDITRLSVRLTL